MNEKNYKDAEDKYSTIIETENKDRYFGRY